MAGFFGFFDYTKPGKGISKDEPPKTGLGLYFDILSRRFWNLISLNLIYLVASIPAIIIDWFIASYFVTWVAANSGINIAEAGSSLMLLGVIVTIILLQMCGSGPATVAMNYVLKKYVDDTHTWVFSDFVDNIKSNFKQGIITYIVNTLGVLVALFELIFYTYVINTSMSYAFRIIVMISLVIFAMMQMYTYQLIAGFELKFRHIYKNAFLLTFIKLPWNILTAAVILAIMYIVYSITINIPIIGILIVLLLFYTLINFTQLFMTNNVVKKLILEPFLSQNTETQEDNNI